MAPSSSKFFHRVAHDSHALKRHLPPLNGSQKVRTIEMAPSFSKLLPRMAHNVYLGWLTKSTIAMAPLNFTLGWLAKGMRRLNVTSKFEFRAAHKRYAPLERLNFIFGWFTKGMRRWNGTLLF